MAKQKGRARPSPCRLLPPVQELLQHSPCSHAQLTAVLATATATATATLPQPQAVPCRPGGHHEQGLRAFCSLRHSHLFFFFPRLSLHWESGSSPQRHTAYFVWIATEARMNVSHFLGLAGETRAVTPACQHKRKPRCVRPHGLSARGTGDERSLSHAPRNAWEQPGFLPEGPVLCLRSQLWQVLS